MVTRLSHSNKAHQKGSWQRPKLNTNANEHQHAISNPNFNAVGHTNVDANTHAVIDVVGNANPLSIFSPDVDAIAHATGIVLPFVHPSIFCGVDAGVLFDFEIVDGFWFV
jgi:hypothetical protein